VTEITVSFTEALAVAVAALKARGASPAHAQATGRALVTAEAEGNRAVGLAHLFTYGDALRDGRAVGDAEPLIEEVTGSVTRVDACEGLPHLGFERALPRLVEGAESQGVAILTLRNGYPCGALGYFARRLAEDHGLTALAAANAGPAVMAASGGTRPVYCTNPLAFAVPTGPAGEEAPALVIDQASSSSSLAKIRAAAEAGREIPEGWALDPAGRPTTDARAALAGTLIPFGGARGANVALMVELLAAALTGANWSQDAPPFNKGKKSPGAGLFIIAVDQSATSGAVRAGSEGGDAGTSEKAPREKNRDFFTKRLTAWIAGVETDNAHLPGLAKGETLAHARHRGFSVDAQMWARIRDLA
jgi:(2R)-3-sulfolactate dehydrogenase (NADP+)